MARHRTGTTNNTAAACSAALARGAVEVALELANEEWEKSQAAEVGHAVELVAARLERTKARAGRSAEAFQALWLRQSEVDGPAATAWLCEHLLTRVPVVTSHEANWKLSYLRKKYAALLDRIERLDGRTPRPLVARAMVGLLSEAPMKAWKPASAHKLYQPVLALLAKTGDARHGDDLARLLEAPRAGQQSVRELLTAVLPPVVSTLRRRGSMPQSLRDAWKTAFPAASASSTEAVKGLEGLVMNDDSRAVLADLLAEQGNPRGEFISLQLRHASGSLDAKGRSRMNALLKQHRSAWLGALEPVCASAVWARGFVVQLTLAQNSVATAEGWLKASRDEALSTVEHLYKGRGNADHLARFALSERAVNLRSTDVLDSSLLEALISGRERNLRTLRLHRVPNAALLARLVNAPSLPQLTRVVFWTTDDERKIERALLESAAFESSRPMTFVFGPEQIAFERSNRSTGQGLLRQPELGWLKALSMKLADKLVAHGVRVAADDDF